MLGNHCVLLTNTLAIKPTKAFPNSIPFSIFFDSSKQSCSILILYLWVKWNPKNSKLQINAVQCVYVELCYKCFTSTYKKLNYNIDISNVSDLLFDRMCFFLDEWSRRHSVKRTNDWYVSQKKSEKNTVKLFWHCVRIRQ